VTSEPISNSLHVAYLANAIPSLSETFVYREIRKLRSLGWPVTVVSLYPHDPNLEENFSDLTTGAITVGQLRNLTSLLNECVTHPVQTSRTLLTAARDALAPGEPTGVGTRLKLLRQALGGIYLASRLRPRGVVHVHCHFAHAPTSVGMYAATQLGIPFSFTGHANDLFQRRALLRRKLERAAFVACISRWHQEFYRSIVGTRPERDRVVRCGIDVDAWTPRQLVTTAERPLRILTVARLVEKKGIDVLIEALPRLHRDAEVIVAGDGPERVRLGELATRLGCSQRIEFLGAVSNEGVRKLMTEADVFVLPCRVDARGDQDGIPVVLMEAMACGLPVICGDLPPIRELIEDGESGRLVPSGDVGALATLLDSLTDQARERLAAAARSKVDREFSLAANVALLQQSVLQAAAVRVPRA
jgi:colanic acid/amylovoran biosynthesis glycosyltransferase